MRERIEALLNRTISRRELLLAASATGAGLWTAAMCGGEEKETKPTEAGQGQPKVTRVAETPTPRPEPTATLIPPTETPESVLSAADIETLIRQGFAGKTFTYNEIPDNRIRDVEAVVGFLHNCDKNGEAIKPIGSPGIIFDPSHPEYRNQLLGECEKVGEATKLLFEVTNKDEFFQANGLMKRFHRAKFDALRSQNPPISENYWTVMETRFYTLTK